MHDVERSIVPGVEHIRVQGAGSIQRIGIRVDVERTLDGTIDRIQRGAQGSRCPLLPVRGIADQVQGHVLEHLEGGIDIGRITLYGALQGPARVVHQGQRRVIVTGISTPGHGNGMVVLHVISEQPVEPVRVPELGCTEVSRLRRIRVLQSILVRDRIEGGNQLVHLSVDTAVGGIRQGCIIQIAFLFQFLVDGHLVLGVHDVEGGVARLQTEGIFTRVVDRAVAGTALLGGHDDNARHGARTIDGSSGAVLENVETLDIFGVETGDRGRNQGVGITGAEVFRVDFHDIFHDDSVHHPERL